MTKQLTFKTWVSQFKNNKTKFGESLSKIYDLIPEVDDWDEIYWALPHGSKGFLKHIFKHYMKNRHDLNILYQKGFLDDEALNKLGQVEKWVVLSGGESLRGVAIKNEDGAFKSEHVFMEYEKTHHVGFYLEKNSNR